jgi:hypothetical protein
VLQFAWFQWREKYSILWDDIRMGVCVGLRNAVVNAVMNIWVLIRGLHFLPVSQNVAWSMNLVGYIQSNRPLG